MTLLVSRTDLNEFIHQCPLNIYGMNGHTTDMKTYRSWGVAAITDK